MSDSSFEVGFAGPSLDNPVLFSQYADLLAAQLRRRHGPSGGYQVSVEKEDKNPKRRKWTVNLFSGWFSGAEVTIKPIEAAPHRAVVKVAWNSRMLEWLAKGVAVVTLLIFIPTFLLFAAATRLGFALILTVILGFVWVLISSIIMTGIARLLALLFGNEFDAQRRAMLLNEIRTIPLPSPGGPTT